MTRAMFQMKVDRQSDFAGMIEESREPFLTALELPHSCFGMTDVRLAISDDAE